MKTIRYLMVAIMALTVFPLRSADDVELTGRTTYYDDGTHTRNECKLLAAEQARVDALARRFGTLVSQDIVQSADVRNGRDAESFMALSMTQVRGEWLGDTSEPQYTFGLDNDGNLTVSCTVSGRARPLSNAVPDFETKALRGGANPASASSDFNAGDDLTLFFRGAADGWVAVFLEDESRTVYSLLPYPTENDGAVKVKRGESYVFFHNASARPEHGLTRELTMTADGRTEYNRLYVVYSTALFGRPMTEQHSSGLPATTTDGFTRWLIKSRRADPTMGLKVINLRIKPSTNS